MTLSESSPRTFLIAGGAGLLGSAIATALLSEGHLVVIADVFDEAGDGRVVKEERAARLSENPMARVVRVDLTDMRAAMRLVEDFHPDALVNAAVFAKEGPGAEPLLSSWASHGLLVHLSDAALYGPRALDDPLDVHAREDAPLPDHEDPALSRRAAEAHLVSILFPDARILRVFDTLGPALPIGRFPVPALEALLAGEQDGLFLPFDPDAPRDFLHVEDAARGVCLALFREDAAGKTVNLGSGIATTPRELLDAIARYVGAPFRAPLSGREGAPRIADMQRAWELLGFAPTRGPDAIAREIVEARLAGLGAPPGASSHGPFAPRHEEPPVRRVTSPPVSVSRRDLFGRLLPGRRGANQ